MFAEMLNNTKEKIFLEAIDQYFENQFFEDVNLINQEISIDSNIKLGKDNAESNLDIEKETDIEIMNIKFYESLDFDSNNEFKDVSTDLESEESSNTEKIFIKISDYLNVSKESIDNNNNKVLKSYRNQIIFEEKIKELFKNSGNNLKNSKEIKDYSN
jgi:hypothetical protein